MGDWEPDCVCTHQAQTHDSRRGGCLACSCSEYVSEGRPSRSVKVQLGSFTELSEAIDERV